MSEQIKTCGTCGAPKKRLCASGNCRRCDAAAPLGQSDITSAASPATPPPVEEVGSPQSAVGSPESKLTTAQRLAALINEIKAEREAHQTAIREIDAMCSMLGIRLSAHAEGVRENTRTEKPSATRRRGHE